MAVTVIDSKGELAEYVAQQTPTETPPADPVKPTEPQPASPAEPDKVRPQVTDEHDDENSEEIDFAKKIGITPEQHQAVTKIFKHEIARQRRYVREAETFAAAQYNEKRVSEARAAELEREVQSLKGGQAVPRETVDPEAGKPKRDKFDSDEKYWEAVIDWRADLKADAKIKEERARNAATEAQRQFEEAERAAQDRVNLALATVPDFEEKVNTGAILIPGDMNDPETAAGYVRHSQMIAELLYYFSEHPEEAKKLAQMRPSTQLVTIGKIEGTLKPFEPKGSKPTNGAKPSKTNTNGNASHEDEPIETGSSPTRTRGTAPVITPLTSGGGLQVEPDPQTMTTRERIVAFQKTHRVNLGLRKRH